uniref:Uncharacterized protein n=1 Tax=Plectus sambesii TaxID=2011161 RepID=A0A914VJ89_9BILA
MTEQIAVRGDHRRIGGLEDTATASTTTRGEGDPSGAYPTRRRADEDKTIRRAGRNPAGGGNCDIEDSLGAGRDSCARARSDRFRWPAVPASRKSRFFFAPARRISLAQVSGGRLSQSDAPFYRGPPPVLQSSSFLYPSAILLCPLQ